MKATEIMVPLVFGTLGVAALVRALWRPARALVWAGKLSRCSGKSSFGVCDPADVVTTTRGEPVYAVTSGRIVAKGPTFIHIASDYEPVILAYQGLAPGVKEGDTVAVGQQIGLSDGELAFTVQQWKKGQQLEYVAPGAWLAARGMAHVQGQTSASWCDTGRSIVVPPDARTTCGFALPDKAAFTLLPVSVDQS
jgi:hypothetical protein